MRSGTLQYLHVSEFGKICAQYPEKAREIVTGALNTVEAGQFIVIESTAEGQEGAFYRMSQEAREFAASGTSPIAARLRFHFFPWWRTKPTRSTRSRRDDRRGIPALLRPACCQGIGLSDAQKAWYVKKDQTMEGDMRREYPSTPDEAFEQALEGAYFSIQLAAAAKQGRIGGFPVDPRYLVNSFWDLGTKRSQHNLAAPVHRRLSPLRRLLRELRRVHRPLCALAEGLGSRARCDIRRALLAA